MGDVKTREGCIALLREKHAELSARGEDRLPKRSDFPEAEVVAIKAFLGPFPRALEAAGLKTPQKTERAELNRKRRAQSKKRKRQAKRAENGGSGDTTDDKVQ